MGKIIKNCAIIIAEGVYKISIQPKGPDLLIRRYTINPAQTGGMDVKEASNATIVLFKKNLFIAIR